MVLLTLLMSKSTKESKFANDYGHEVSRISMLPFLSCVIGVDGSWRTSQEYRLDDLELAASLHAFHMIWA